MDVAAFVPPDLAVSFRVAAELVKARLGGTPRRHRSPEGVTVASFVPMRALPFRMIFVAGLDERVFPAPDGVRALDLRSGAPRPGDVSAREQDQHMFLETLLAARERITLSYVARDAVTGEPRAPSSVVEALLDLAEPDRARETAPAATAEGAPSEILRARPPLARHEDPAACAVIPAAARERRAAALGASLRRAGGGVRQLPPPSELRGALGPDAWASVAADLDWVAPPPAVAATRARRGLTLIDLRRFLECPLQASARVLLPVGDDADAMAEAEAALREHEPLDEARASTIPFLRNVLTGLLADPAHSGDDQQLVAAYDRAAIIQRLEGKLPDGLFGRALGERHLGLLRCWRDGLLQATGGLLVAPTPIWLGSAPEHRRDVVIRPALAVPIAEGATVAVGGRTELCARAADESRVVLSLTGSTNQDKLERDLLGPFLTHLALAALGDEGASSPTRAIVIQARERRDAVRRGAPLLADLRRGGARLPGPAGLGAAARGARLFSPLRGGLLLEGPLRQRRGGRGAAVDPAPARRQLDPLCLRSWAHPRPTGLPRPVRSRGQRDGRPAFRPLLRGVRTPGSSAQEEAAMSTPTKILYPFPAELGRIARDRSAVIEASAGTGKTFLIEHLVVDRLVRGDARLEEMLVVTFTDRAAAELRRRIGTLIKKVATTGESTASGTSVWTIDDEARARLDSAARAIDGAPISTIHAFCQRVLTEQAFAGGRLLVQQSVESRAAFAAAFAEVLRQELAVDGEHAPYLEAYLAAGGKCRHGGQPGGAALPGAPASRAVGNAVRSRTHRRTPHGPSRASRRPSWRRARPGCTGRRPRR